MSFRPVLALVLPLCAAVSLTGLPVQAVAANGAKTQPLAVLPRVHTPVVSDYEQVTRLTRAGQAQQAIERAQAYIANHPRDPQMRFLKGVAQTEAGQTEAAIATFVQLTEEYPELAEPHNNLAVLYAAQGQLDQARLALEAAIRNQPGYAVAHENLGDIYLRLAHRAYGEAQRLGVPAQRLAPKLTLMRQLLELPAAPRRP